MPLTRCSAQSKSLEDFYSELASDNNSISARIGKSMLQVIDLINKTFTDTKIYGLTSHHNLLLLSEDDWTSEWYIAIIGNGVEYNLEYRMTKESQPWENALITGGTNSIEKFRNFIIIAMFETQGWQKSEELTKLYNQIKK